MFLYGQKAESDWLRRVDRFIVPRHHKLPFEVAMMTLDQLVKNPESKYAVLAELNSFGQRLTCVCQQERAFAPGLMTIS